MWNANPGIAIKLVHAQGIVRHWSFFLIQNYLSIAQELQNPKCAKSVPVRNCMWNSEIHKPASVNRFHCTRRFWHVSKTAREFSSPGVLAWIHYSCCFMWLFFSVRMPVSALAHMTVTGVLKCSKWEMPLRNKRVVCGWGRPIISFEPKLFIIVIFWLICLFIYFNPIALCLWCLFWDVPFWLHCIQWLVNYVYGGDLLTVVFLLHKCSSIC